MGRQISARIISSSMLRIRFGVWSSDIIESSCLILCVERDYMDMKCLEIFGGVLCSSSCTHLATFGNSFQFSAWMMVEAGLSMTRVLVICDFVRSKKS